MKKINIIIKSTKFLLWKFKKSIEKTWIEKTGMEWKVILVVLLVSTDKRNTDIITKYRSKGKNVSLECLDSSVIYTNLLGFRAI